MLADPNHKDSDSVISFKLDYVINDNYLHFLDTALPVKGKFWDLTTIADELKRQNSIK